VPWTRPSCRRTRRALMRGPCPALGSTWRAAPRAWRAGQGQRSRGHPRDARLHRRGAGGPGGGGLRRPPGSGPRGGRATDLAGRAAEIAKLRREWRDARPRRTSDAERGGRSARRPWRRPPDEDVRTRTSCDQGEEPGRAPAGRETSAGSCGLAWPRRRTGPRPARGSGPPPADGPRLRPGLRSIRGGGRPRREDAGEERARIGPVAPGSVLGDAFRRSLERVPRHVAAHAGARGRLAAGRVEAPRRHRWRADARSGPARRDPLPLLFRLDASPGRARPRSRETWTGGSAPDELGA